MSEALGRLGYARARLVLAGAGLGVLCLLSLLLLIRSVDRVEVAGTLLYAPVFLALLYRGVRGGIVGAVAATGFYVWLRSDAIEVVGFSEYAGLIVSRSLAYLFFGVVGGWAASTLSVSLDKLDLYDHIDDSTGLQNARFLLEHLDTEMARSQRYQTIFSVSFVDIPVGPIAALAPRRRRVVLAALGQKLSDAVRTVDRVAHGVESGLHRVAVVLPETGEAGAATFHRRLESELHDFLVDQGAGDGLVVTGSTVTIPGDDAALAAHLERWRRIDTVEHGR